MTRISWRVNLVSRHRSSSATGIGFGARVGSSSYTTSSIGLSGGVAIFSLTQNAGQPQHYGRSIRFPVLLRILTMPGGFCLRQQQVAPASGEKALGTLGTAKH
uniref:Uncharacterized protein n=1 Tax=Anopheles farauti TaxID=69004 RepID=A0A182QCU9_9DIPT